MTWYLLYLGKCNYIHVSLLIGAMEVLIASLRMDFGQTIGFGAYLALILPPLCFMVYCTLGLIVNRKDNTIKLLFKIMS